MIYKITATSLWGEVSTFEFDNKQDFLSKLRELKDEGVGYLIKEEYVPATEAV
jgi:hypothetical protein